MRGLLGYGRYNDDPSHIGCPRASTDMTPCVARDGHLAEAEGSCVGCGAKPADLLTELVAAVTETDDDLTLGEPGDLMHVTASVSRADGSHWRAQADTTREVASSLRTEMLQRSDGTGPMTLRLVTPDGTVVAEATEVSPAGE